jgi:hypothetical protein
MYYLEQDCTGHDIEKSPYLEIFTGVLSIVGGTLVKYKKNNVKVFTIRNF